MKKIVIATVAAFVLGTAALASPAEARCSWNGYAWHCWHPTPGTTTTTIIGVPTDTHIDAHRHRAVAPVRIGTAPITFSLL